jgi:hypothetical protein
MAERRMFAKTIIDSDAFLDMGASAQSLYFHLAMRADDDGFINNPRKIQRMIGAADDDLKILIAKRFVIMFESGVIVIKHWRMHNYIRADRYNETAYIDEKSQLTIKENGSYTLNGNHLATTCLPDGNHLDTQVSIGKDSIGKDSIGKDTKHKHGEYKNVLLSDDDLEKLKAEFPDWAERIERLSEYIESKGASYKNHLATIRAWARKDKDTTGKPVSRHKVSFQDYDQDQGVEQVIPTGPDLLKEAREKRNA